jgi:hypothetical protein
MSSNSWPNKLDDFCQCPSQSVGNSGIDTLKRFHFLAGFQIAGSAIAAPLIGFEFDISNKWYLRYTRTVAFHYFYESISYEYTERLRFNYRLNWWASVSLGVGFGVVANPKFVKNPADPRFSGCGFSNCPYTEWFWVSDLGFQFSPFKKVPLQFNTLFSVYSYGINGFNIPMKDNPIGPFLTIELNYKFL